MQIFKSHAMALRALFVGLAMLSFSTGGMAQVKNVVVHKNDGTVLRIKMQDVDSITIEDIPQWANRSAEARKLLTYMQDNEGQKMLTGVHACVNYNTSEADWVYKHTGKYPAINCFDYIHDIYSSTGGWIDYSNATTWKNWTNKRGLVAAMWHWGMPSNDGSTYTCTPGTEPGETSFRPSAIFDPTSADYKAMIARIDQVAQWMKPLAAARVPILWRPFHEAQGNWSEQYPGTSWHKAWFWWGIDGPEAFVELWRVMYDRLVNYHGLTNLIWVYNTGDSMRWYPGDEFVDVVAYDFYNQTLSGMHKWYDFIKKNFPDKLCAISEFGNIPKMSQVWADGQYWSFMIPWWDNARTGQPGSEAFNSTDHNNADIDYWKDALKQDFIITRDELPNFR